MSTGTRVGWKDSLTRWLERRWYGGVAPNAALGWLERLFTRIVVQRRREFLYGAAEMLRPAVPVVVIGNLTIGGAGKTPLTVAVVQALQARGLRPGVVSRGYGRREHTLRLVQAGDTAADAGDEPLLIARRTGVPVAVAPGRYMAAKRLERDAQIDVVVADDGLQHYSLMRDIEILVVDGRRGFGNGRLLPAGPLREPLTRAADCEFVVVNRGTDGQGNAFVPPDTLLPNTVDMHLRGDHAVALADGMRVPLAKFRGQRVHAVAGIADPERFFATLREHGIDVVPHAFPDHHAFTDADLAFGDDLPVLMTEKDATKCAAAAGRWSVPVDAVLPEAWFDTLAARVRAIAQQLAADA